MKVLLLNNIPAPYLTPLFARVGEESGWELTVAYNSAWNADAGWREGEAGEGRGHATLILDRERPHLTAAVALARWLARERPDYVISYGYTQMPQTTLILWAAATGTPLAVVGDANVYTERAAGWRRAAKRVWLQWLVGRAAALITIGTANRLLWESYGARPEQLYEARFAVDNDFYARAVAARRAEAAALRARLGWEERVVFLSVGRLIGRKKVDLLIRAARLLDDERIAVLIAGDGEERGALEALAAGEARLHFAGRVRPDELPLYYAAADVLVLPARQEPWGLVVNEAMAAGLAVIAHRHCGAAVDLVGPDNGAALAEFSEVELAAAMREVAADRARLRALKERSREKIGGWTIPAAARGLIRAVEETARAHAARVGTVAPEKLK